MKGFLRSELALYCWKQKLSPANVKLRTNQADILPRARIEASEKVVSRGVINVQLQRVESMGPSFLSPVLCPLHMSSTGLNPDHRESSPGQLLPEVAETSSYVYYFDVRCGGNFRLDEFREVGDFVNFFVTNASLIFVANIRDNKFSCWKTQLYGIILRQKIDYLVWYCILVIILINKYFIEFVYVQSGEKFSP